MFGSSGDLGIRRDGTQLRTSWSRRKRCGETEEHFMGEAAGIGVPFHRHGRPASPGIPTADEIVLVMAVNGKVGQAATQIATWHGARVSASVRRNEAYEGHSNSQVEVIDASATDVASRVRELTGGKGAEIVFNTVGDPYFEAAHKSLGLRGRQILIAAVDRIVQFNILEFYRGQHTYVGIDTLGLSSVATGAVLRELGPGFAGGHLRPFPIKANAVYPLEQAKAAFMAVAGSSPIASSSSLIVLRVAVLPVARNKSLHRSAQRFCFPMVGSCERFILCVGRPGRSYASQRNISRNCILFDNNSASAAPRIRKTQCLVAHYRVSGLLSGRLRLGGGVAARVCLLSGLALVADGDGRRSTYALAIGSVAAPQWRAGRLVDIGKSSIAVPFGAVISMRIAVRLRHGVSTAAARARWWARRGNLAPSWWSWCWRFSPR